MNYSKIKHVLGKVFMCIIFLGGIVWMSSCSDIDCPVTDGVWSNYVVKGDTLHDTLTISAIRENKPDTILLNKQVNTTKFSLPMSYNGEKDKLRFVFTSKAGVTTIDTVTISKTNISHFESVDCSPTFFHTLTAVTAKGTRVKKVDINNPNVDYDGTKEHIFISFTNP